MKDGLTLKTNMDRGNFLSVMPGNVNAELKKTPQNTRLSQGLFVEKYCK